MCPTYAVACLTLLPSQQELNGETLFKPSLLLLKQVGTVTASKQVKSKKNVRLTLEKDHFEWLRDMAQKHNLPDDGELSS